MNEWLTVDFWREIAAGTAQWIIRTIPSLFLTLVVAFVTLRLIKIFLRKLRQFILNRLNKKPSDTGEQEKRVGTLINILASAIRIVLLIMIVMLVLRNIGIDIGPLLAGAGIAGLALGFGAQELVRDIISGFFILLENQVREGDVAIINNTRGIVEEVSLRTVVLRDISGVVHIFQNGKIDTLANMTKGWSAMVFDIGIAYKEDVDAVAQVMKSTATELASDPDFASEIIEPMEVMGVEEFADSAVIVRARLKTRPRQQWVIGREYRRRLKKAFDARGIEIPFPHVSVYWGSQTEDLRVRTAKHEYTG